MSFRYEFPVSGTTLNLIEAHTVFNRYSIDAKGVPETVKVECRITPIEYIENLRNTLSRAKAEGVSSGNTNRKPLARQKGWMARVMNAAGFHYPQWMKFIKNMEEDKIESIREEEDGEDKDNVVLDIY